MVTRQVCKSQETRALKRIFQKYGWKGIFYREELFTPLPLQSSSLTPHLFSATMPNPFSNQITPLSRIRHVLVPSFCFQTLFPLSAPGSHPAEPYTFSIGPGNLAQLPHYIIMVNTGYLSLMWVAHLFKWTKRYTMEKRGCVLFSWLADLYSSEAMGMGDIKIQSHHSLCIYILSVLILNGNLYSFALKVI